MRSKKLRMPRFGALVASFVGLAVVLTGCGSVYDLPLPGGANVGSNPLKIHVMFHDVMDLVPQSTVKVNDVSVGKVTAIKLQGQVANVTVEIPNSTNLPANTFAMIRQTSLLGEKFVSLCTPGTQNCVSGTPTGKLVNGATIGIGSSRTNPQIEEVFKAFAALLSGGGVGQLKLISEELNQAIGGKESQVRSVLTKLHYFMGQLDQSKTQIVTAIDNLNRLAVSLKKQDPTIAATLDDIPAALASVNGQRADLVKMLTALNKLSGVGVKVIQASKTATIDSLTHLAPVLSMLAAAGDNLPKSFQIFLTYPFVDAVVGQTPTAARNFEMGDYTNLSVNLDLDLAHLTIPGLPGMTLPGLVQLCNTSPLTPVCKTLGGVVSTLCSGLLKNTPACVSGASAPKTTTKTPSGSTSGGGKTGTGGLLSGLNLSGLLGRTAYGSSGSVKRTPGDGMSYLLLQGAMQ
ncbi:MAG: MCE family protein [Marmoricola sp.]